MNNISQEQLQSTIDQAWENRAQITLQNASPELRNSISQVIEGLNMGEIRVATKESVGVWNVNQWVKKAVLLSFKLQDNEVMGAGGYTQFFDKVPSKFEKYTHEDFVKGGFRVVPPAIARRGSFIGKNVVLMPSYVNIGAFVDEGSMIDTWATVGS
jgi:2,3,4,5-tetrahydropyridine-2-carboxylate N-succinyltransferase